jgi:hypothetical protein
VSAVAKLRELDQCLPHAPTHVAAARFTWDLRNALPQIVAVVEAAEREHPQPHNYWAIDANMNETEECPMCAALAALDEALS